MEQLKAYLPELTVSGLHFTLDVSLQGNHSTITVKKQQVTGIVRRKLARTQQSLRNFETLLCKFYSL